MADEVAMDAPSTLKDEDNKVGCSTFSKNNFVYTVEKLRFMKYCRILTKVFQVPRPPLGQREALRMLLVMGQWVSKIR